ncbi:hypothetical protein H0H81_012321 [Sphagnurus paluster]|uniref:Uncharacterized protein n=1 Tax=Sphagnurus paluster TaxID=117069 RepID=A0A9P7GJF8_9AGAR|nr:hypothetical protein H0H81_012321 [Sphagnurus paluster]
MKLTLLEYLQSLGVTVRGGKEAGTEAVMLPQVQVLLDIGSHGFPILPTPASALIKKRKKDLVSVIRQYLGIHYRLASWGRKGRTPWDAIEADNTSFVAAKFLPCGKNFCLGDPHNMSIADLHRLLEHWQERQEKYGPTDTFHWSTILDKEKTQLPANYVASLNSSTGTTHMGQSKKKGRSTHVIQMNGLISMTPIATDDEDGCGTDHSDGEPRDTRGGGHGVDGVGHLGLVTRGLGVGGVDNNNSFGASRVDGADARNEVGGGGTLGQQGLAGVTGDSKFNGVRSTGTMIEVTNSSGGVPGADSGADGAQDRVNSEVGGGDDGLSDLADGDDASYHPQQLIDHATMTDYMDRFNIPTRPACNGPTDCLNNEPPMYWISAQELQLVQDLAHPIQRSRPQPRKRKAPTNQNIDPLLRDDEELREPLQVDVRHLPERSVGTSTQ